MAEKMSKRKDKRYEIKVSIGSGKRISVYGSTEAEARRKAKALREEAARYDLSNISKLSVQSYVEHWLYTVKIHELKPASFDRLEQSCIYQIFPHIGVDTRNGIAQALKEMGYGSGKETIARWREVECKVLTEICVRHGIQIAAPEKSRGSLTVEQYKEYAKIKEQVEEKKEEVSRLDERAECADRLLKHREELRAQVDEIIDKLEEQYQEKNAAVAQLDEQIEEKSSALTQTAAELADKQSLLETSAAKVAKLKSISEIETGKTMFGGKVTLSREDYGALTDLAMNQIAAESKENELSTEISRLKKENEQAAVQIAAQKQEILRLYPLKEELRKAKNELSILNLKLQKVLDFVDNMKLMQKLKEFLVGKSIRLKRH